MRYKRCRYFWTSWHASMLSITVIYRVQSVWIQVGIRYQAFPIHCYHNMLNSNQFNIEPKHPTRGGYRGLHFLHGRPSDYLIIARWRLKITQTILSVSMTIFSHDIGVARPIIMQIFPCLDQWSSELVQQKLCAHDDKYLFCTNLKMLGLSGSCEGANIVVIC